MATIHPTREAWLSAAIAYLRPDIKAAINNLNRQDFRVAFPDFAGLSVPYSRGQAGCPDALRVSCSNPTGGINNRVIGQCIDPAASNDNHWEIWISPKLDDPTQVLTTLLHELIHATINDHKKGGGHGPRFWRLARPLGFARPLTSAALRTDLRGRTMRRRFETIAEALGDYPHGSVNFTALRQSQPKQTTRNLKVECLTDGCGFKVRMSRSWVAHATPLCPVCEGLGVHSRAVVVLGSYLESLEAPGARLVQSDGDDVLIICNLAGRSVHPDGSEDAEAVEQAAILRAEREERERVAREAAEEAARVAAREARAAELSAATPTSRNDAGIDTSETGVVAGQGVQNRYGDSESRRDRRQAERDALPLLTFDGVAPGIPTWIRLLEEAARNRSDMNDIEDACIRYCDRRGARRVSRLNLMEARRAMGAAARLDIDYTTPEPTPSAPPRDPSARSARFAGLDFAD
jgi:hypothetical protein